MSVAPISTPAGIELTELEEVLTRWPAALLASSEGRRIATRTDPQLFAAIYLRHHLRGPETGNQVSYALCHTDWYAQMESWMAPISKPRSWRRAYVAPRGSAKTTHWFLFAPMWAGAHGHATFIAAFSDGSKWAERHLADFRHELDTNELLRRDYPELCTPMKRKTGTRVSDNVGLYQASNGFIFAAAGIDAASLGMKVGERRPDVLILDDVEKGESNYSAYLAAKRLHTLQDDILYLNEHARVVWVGTVTMSGSLINQLIEPEPKAWVTDARFVAHHYPAILTDPDGTERSIWPAKWPMQYLATVRHTRDFAKNMMNRPVPDDGAYWVEEDFEFGELDAPTRVLLSIDPAVTTKARSDQTGMSILALDPSVGKVEVRECFGVKLRGNELRTRVLDVLVANPDIGRVLIEVNQGGDLWAEVLHDLPVPTYTISQSEKKEVRASRLLTHYQQHRIKHARPLYELQQQMLEYPLGPHDDLIDATGTGVDYLLKSGRPAGVQRRTRSYI